MLEIPVRGEGKLGGEQSGSQSRTISNIKTREGGCRAKEVEQGFLVFWLIVDTPIVREALDLDDHPGETGRSVDRSAELKEVWVR